MEIWQEVAELKKGCSEGVVKWSEVAAGHLVKACEAAGLGVVVEPLAGGWDGEVTEWVVVREEMVVGGRCRQQMEVKDGSVLQDSELG